MTYRALLEIIIRNGNVDGLQAKYVADQLIKTKLVRWKGAHDGYQAVYGRAFDHDFIHHVIGEV